jgi:hypothetical protein
MFFWHALHLIIASPILLNPFFLKPAGAGSDFYYYFCWNVAT